MPAAALAPPSPPATSDSHDDWTDVLRRIARSSERLESLFRDPPPDALAAGGVSFPRVVKRSRRGPNGNP